MYSGGFLKKWVFALLALSAVGRAEPNYDEVYKSGVIRPQYAPLAPLYRQTPEQVAAYEELTRKRLGGEYALAPFPIVVTQSEQQRLAKGVEQRGLALRMFLQDYYSGRHTYRDTVIPGPVIDAITARTGDHFWQGYLDPKRISFRYGPDIAVGPNGERIVVEDNEGAIGSWGDMHTVRDILLEQNPELKKLGIQDDPLKFHAEVMARYQRRAVKGRTVITLGRADLEDKRLDPVYRGMGAVPINPYNMRTLLGHTEIWTSDTGVWAEHHHWGERRNYHGGFAALAMEPNDIDWDHPAAYRQELSKEAQKQLAMPALTVEHRAAIEKAQAVLANDPDALRAVLKATGLPNQFEETFPYRQLGFTKALLAGQINADQTPGISMIGDKQFYPFVNALIRHYLKEEPLLQDLKTRGFLTYEMGQPPKFNSANLESTLQNREHLVLKRVDGRGGDGVWVGKYTSPDAWAALREQIEREPGAFIVQEFIPFSEVNGMILDRRLVALVDPYGVLVSPTVVVRANVKTGDGKVNLSLTGRGLPTIVLRDDGCRSAFRGMLARLFGGKR